MGLKEDLIMQSLAAIGDVQDCKVEDVSLNVYDASDDGLKRLIISIDYNDKKRRIQTKNGEMWIDSNLI